MNSSDNKDEISLIEACIKGDNKAQKKLYDKHAPIMYAICLRYMTNEDEAKDALQEGFIKAFTNLSKFRFSGSFEGWLKRIFVNASIELIRKRKVHFDVDDLVPSINQADYMQTGTMDAEKMMELVQTLPQGYRTVFNMYVVDGFSHKEISEELNISESTSKTQLFKARKQLQELLKGWFE